MMQIKAGYCGIVQLRNVKYFEKYFLLDGKVAKTHERNFHECSFE